jgi:Fe-Mn family superoxide dismutase
LTSISPVHTSPKRTLNTRLAVARDGAGVAHPPTHPASRVHALPPLPYLDADLAPVISSSTVRLHYGKRNAGYIEELNGLIAGTRYADLSIAQTI